MTWYKIKNYRTCITIYKRFNCTRILTVHFITFIWKFLQKANEAYKHPSTKYENLSGSKIYLIAQNYIVMSI